MANSILTPSIIAKEALMQLENNLIMGRKVYREYSKEFVKVGDTVSVRRPVKFEAKDGATLQTQDVTEGKFPLKIDKRKHVGWKFDTQTLTLSIEEYSERYIKPAMMELANTIDYDLAALYSSVWNWVGTPASPVNSFADFAKAPERLDLGAVPQGQRAAVLSPTDFWGMVGSQTALHIQQAASGAYRQGDLGMIGGVVTGMDQNINTHTVGTYGGSPEVNNANQDVTYLASKDTNSQSLITQGWSSGATTLNKGDVFEIEGVYAVNPRSRKRLPHRQQFVVNETVSDVAGAITVNISPAIITSGPYQTVDAAPASGADIFMIGTTGSLHAQNLVFHKNAFALVMRPLEMPDGVSFKARESQNGYSVRVIKDYDIVNDMEIIRLDVLYGCKALYPDLATRLSGTS